MRIIIKDGQPTIEGLPEGNVVLFFGLISRFWGYAVIYGPPDKCLPNEGEGETFSELFAARVAFGMAGEEMKTYPVKHGHKYSEGGGYVETLTRGQFFFQMKGKRHPSSYKGEPIEEVIVAL
jgi:hypothetical protein